MSDTFADLNNHIRLGGTFTGGATDTFVNITATGNVELGTDATNTLGFYGTAGVVQPVVPMTTPDAQDIIDALVALGLVSQSD